MLKKLLFCSTVALLATQHTTAQVKIGNNPTVIDSASILELESPNKALYLTRVALATTTDVVTVPAPKAGMVVYNTNVGITGTVANPAVPGGVGVYFYNGTRWVGSIGPGAADSSVAKFSTAGNVRVTQDGDKLRADLNVRLDTAGGLVTYEAYAHLLARIQELETGTGINAHLNFTGSSGVVETTKGSRVWKAVAGGAAGSYGNRGISVQTFDANTDGVMAITEYQAGTTGDYYASVTGLSREFYLSANVYAYGIDKATGKVFQGGSAPSSGVTLSTGDLVGIRRTAGALKIVRSTNSGITWVDVFNLNISDNGKIRVVVDVKGSSGAFMNPKNQ